MTDTNQRKPRTKRRGLKFFLCGMHYLHRLIVTVARYIFAAYYKNSYREIPAVEDSRLMESTVDLAESIRTKKIKSEELTKLYIERIKAVNPILNFLIEDRFEDALAEARKADELINSGQMTKEQLLKEKPFLGVPFTTKDCISVKGLHWTAGLYSRKDVIADEDAEVIANLRKAGAIPLGLTNVPELCMWWETNNTIYGRTDNAYDTRRGVGGSSGGEGCIQSVCGSAFGIGSDIGGSIRMPSMFNGIFGHKPSKFAVSNVGQFPATYSEYQESFLGTGPMTRRAVDLKPVLKIAAGKNADKLNLDREVDLKKIKVYYQKDNLKSAMICDVEPSIRKALAKAVSHLNSVCDRSAEQVKIKKLIKSTDIWMANMKVSGAPTFGERMTGKDGVLHIWIEMVKVIFGKSENTFVGLLTALMDLTGAQPGSKKHDEMIECRQELEDEFKDMLRDDGVFLYPTHPTGVPYHNESIVRAFNFSYTAIINSLGLPATHIPMGLNEEGLPIGFQVISNFNNDRLCLAVAEELDKVFGGWVEPGKTKKES